MIQTILSVRSILAAIFIMMIGAGYLGTLIPLRLQNARADAFTIALLTTAYFAGLTAGSLRVPTIVNRVGHIRAFAAFVSLFSATALCYALLHSAPLWTVLRLIDGFCVAGVFVCLESWLNDRGEAGSRGTILAAYMSALYLGQAAGQQLLNLGSGTSAIGFVLASIPISLAVIPVALTRMSAPPLQEHRFLSVGRLYRASPLGFVGAIVSGIFLGAFYGLGAAYARRIGMSMSDTALFMTVVILGGVVLQWPLGRLSDAFDRRRIIVITLAGCLAVTLPLALAASGAVQLMLAAAFGGLSFALYPLSVGHTNDHLAPALRVPASGVLVLLYSLGAAAGPLLAAGAMTLAGPGGLFAALSACAGAALIFAFWRQAARPPVPLEQQQPYRALPRTTPVAALVDDGQPPLPDDDDRRVR